MQPFKLSKAKSQSKLNSVRRESGTTFKTSFDDLRNPDGRESLRDHFSSAFPENHTRRSLDSRNNSFDADTRPALSRSTSYSTTPRRTSTVASTPSTDSLSVMAGPKRLSTVREQSNAADITSAIKMLEELKKTATAAELVALHKALLPSRSPRPEDDSAPGLIRQKSMLPPGIATRNASGDLLKTPEEAAAESRSKKRANSRNRTTPLLDHFQQPLERSRTPDYFNVHMGHYTPGSLRVTNGSASPTPSALLDEARKSAEHFETAPSTPVGNDSHQYSAIAADDAFHLDNTMVASLQTHQADLPRRLQKPYQKSPSKRDRRSSEPATCSIPVPDGAPILSPRVYRPSRGEKEANSQGRSREASRSRMAVARSQRQSNSQLPTPREGRPMVREMASIAEASHTGRAAVAAQEPNIVRPASAMDSVPPPEELLRPNSRTDLPRFAQRLSYRMSQLPPELEEPSQLPSNPEQSTTNDALASLAQRLSKVSDRSSASASSPIAEHPGNSEAALAKLNGVGHTPGDLIIVPDSMMTRTGDRPIPKSADSGYASELSQIALPSSEAREGMPLRAVDDVFYSADAIPEVTAVEPKSRRHLSLLGISIGRKTTATHAHSNSNSSTDANATEMIGGEQQVTKLQKKKLQKAFPASVKREIKAQRKKSDEAKRQAIEAGNVPSVPDNVRSSFSRRTPLDWSVLGTDPADYAANVSHMVEEDNKIPQSSESSAMPTMRRRSLTADSQTSGSTATIVPRGHPRFREDRAVGHTSTRSDDTTTRSTYSAQLLTSRHYERQPSTVTTGMDDSAAAEYARRRSRDLAPEPFNRPVTATPRRSTISEYNHSRPPTTEIGEARLLQVMAFSAGATTLSRQASSVYGPVPPMPRLPSAVGSQAVEEDKSAAKRSKEEEERPAETFRNESALGHSTESVADAVKRAAEHREPAGYSTESVADAIRKMQTDAATKKRKSKSKKKLQKKSRLSSEEDEIPVELAESQADSIPIHVDHAIPPLPVEDAMITKREEQQVLPSLVSAAEPAPEVTDWEEEAKVWRRRRRTMEAVNQRASDDQAQIVEGVHQRKRASTSSVHTIPRKPLAGSIRNSTTSYHQRTRSAEEHAESYRDLIDNEENPSYDGVGWRDSSGTFATMHSANEFSEDDNQRLSTSASRNAPPPRPSTDAEAMVRHFRDRSLARLEGESAVSSSRTRQVPPVPKLPRSAVEPRTAPGNVPPPQFRGRSRKEPEFNSLIIGRYSGGLDWMGLGREASGWDEAGVDMTEVPVYQMQAQRVS